MESEPGSAAEATALAVDAPAASGVAVVGEGEVVVPADGARVVLQLGFSGLGLGRVSAQDEEDIRASLEGLGIDPGGVEFFWDSFIGAASMRVKVDVAGLPEIAREVEDAVEDVVVDVHGAGLHLVVDDCSSKLEPARETAVAEARAAAETLAAAAGATLGELMSVTETADPFSYGAAADPCDPAAIGDGAGLVPYDAPLEVELSYYVAARFAIDGAAGSAAVTAEGRGEVVGDADLATVVVLPDVDSESFAPVADGDDREQVLTALADVGIGRDSVRFVPLLYGGVIKAVAVEVDVDALPELGREIADAVEDVRGSISDAGVLFSSSSCAELIADAQEAAVAAADERITALGATAGVEVGGLTDLIDVDGGGWVAASASGLISGAFEPAAPCEVDDTIRALDPYGEGIGLDSFDSEPHITVASVVVVGRAAG